MDSRPLIRTALAMMALSFVSACVAPSNPPPRTGTAAAPTERFRAAPTMRGFGIDSVVGRRAQDLLNRFGEARIDLGEGDARKLQFASNRCVLDVFLYPRAAGGEPVASYVEARDRRTGVDTDRATCIADVARDKATR